MLVMFMRKILTLLSIEMKRASMNFKDFWTKLYCSYFTVEQHQLIVFIQKKEHLDKLIILWLLYTEFF